MHRRSVVGGSWVSGRVTGAVAICADRTLPGRLIVRCVLARNAIVAAATGALVEPGTVAINSPSLGNMADWCMRHRREQASYRSQAVWSFEPDHWDCTALTATLNSLQSPESQETCSQPLSDSVHNSERQQPPGIPFHRAVLPESTGDPEFSSHPLYALWHVTGKYHESTAFRCRD